MKLNEFFKFHKAKSKGFEDYEKGNVAFVTNGFTNNGIVGYVMPKKGDKVFNFEGICISAFGEATVQKPPFLPRGNGGSGLLVLEPKENITSEKLFQIAAYINQVHRWRFSYGRMANAQRVKNLEIKISENIKLKNTIIDLIPYYKAPKKSYDKPKISIFNITTFFDLERGQFHALDALKEGKYPTVSRVAYNNGIVGFFDKPKNAKIYPKGSITVATTTGDAFVQLDDFIATDNVVILLPKIKFSLEELFFVAAMINREKWRISYGRQCYKTIFAKTNIFLPVRDGNNIDHEYIKKIVSCSYDFEMIKSYVETN